ncbi:MAG: histidinol-phosphate transaminase [Candidatus Melainabacteria bacterium]|nr:histidinol-phosphate transaminase [Candidatus Melainabacteria bacterium]
MTNLVRDDIAQTEGYAPGEQPSDTTTIKLNTNENPYPPSPKALAAIAAIATSGAEQVRRYPDPTARAFREEAARLHGVPADWILTFNGGDDLLNVIIRTCAGEGDAVAFLEPSYSLYPVLTQIQAARPLVLSYEIDGTDWKLPADIESTDAALLLIVNPNAPSGHLEPIESIESVVRNFRGVVLIDEAYVNFAKDSALPLVHKYNNVVILRSMSKGYSLAGLRFGYAIAQPSLLKELVKVRDSYPCDVVSIAAATAALADQEYARSTWEKVCFERERLYLALSALGFSMPQSHSNFLLAQVPAGANAESIYKELKSRSILVRWWNLPRLADKVRITVGTEEQNDKLLSALEDIVSSVMDSSSKE